MKRIAKFEKVSKERFIKDWLSTFLCNEPKSDIDDPKDKNLEADQYKEDKHDEAGHIYDNIKLPKRATSGSAGYDFYSPLSFSLNPGETILIPTGIRVKIEEGWVLKFYPRSGLGFKYRLQLNNTVGIIDSDYYASDNEGHIFCKLTNDTNEGKIVCIGEGTAFMQGIFVEYGITFDDDTTDVRNGGLGSTS